MEKRYENVECTVVTRVENIDKYEITYILVFHSKECKSSSFSAAIRNEDGSVIFGCHDDQLFKLMNRITDFLSI